MKSGLFSQQDGTTLAGQNALSTSQERLWMFEQLLPGNFAQNFALGLRFHESVVLEELQLALGKVIEQHEILRTEFRAVDGIPRQVLSNARVAVESIDLREFANQERESQLSRLAQDELQNPFDLANGPLLRARFFQLDNADCVFLVIVHRIICDPISLRLLLQEMESHYRRRAARVSKPASERSLHYRELADQESVDSQQQLSYWKQQLVGASGIDLPTDHPRPPVQTFRGAKQKTRIEPPLLQGLRSLGQRYNVTLFTTLLAAFNTLLFRYSGEDNLVVGTRVSGRTRPGSEKLIGPLENLLALRTDVSRDPSFSELLARVREVTQAAFSHQDVHFEILVKELNLERDMSRHPLFQIIFTAQDAAQMESVAQKGLTLYEVDSQAEQFDFTVECVTREEGLEVKCSYNSDLFEPSTIKSMMGHFRILLESAAANPELQISRMPLLSEVERHQLLVQWNHTPVSYSPVECIHQLFEEQVERTPDNVAVVFEDQSLTYRELNRRANQLAHYLRKSGVGPDARVGICLERGFDMIVGLLAVLKAGGAYVPLDPAYPRKRLQFMLQDSVPAVLLTERDLRERFTGIVDQVPVLDMGTVRSWELEAETNPGCTATGITPRNVAYVIYTSGSTGTPKGVMVEHANVARLFTATDAWFRFNASDVWSLFHSYAFDFSVWEIWGALLYGGRLVIVPRDVARSPEDFYELLCRSNVTVLNQTPSAFRQLITAQRKSKKLHRLRYIIFGGEALETATLKPWYEQNQSQNTKLINMYGITETTVHVTYRPLTQSDTDRRGGSPVGCRIPDLRIYILDGQLQPVPVGVVGELYVGGTGVARGYLNRPELTAARFLRDPFIEDLNARVYKTGDLGRWVGNGEIEFLGRNDLQVKIRGFRIELGEIEARLSEQAGVLEAVVIAREDTPGDRRLVAYYTTASTQEGVSAEKLRMRLSACLPDYMVPGAYVRLKSLPLTTNGKLDRKALPAPLPDRDSSAVAVAPGNELESKLASTFASILGLPSVGVTDNFFHLGGHSFLAACLVAKVQEVIGRQIPLSALFRGPTVRSLAQLIEQETVNVSDPVVIEIQRGDPSRLPFFAIVPPGEESLGYAMLARHMGPQQTVYKIQGYAPVTRGKRPYTKQEMEALTEEYIAAIRTVQAHGPYCLGGLCDGTHIAEQIVLRLESRNEEIGLFAIFDTWVLQHSQRRWLWKIFYFSQRLREMKQLTLAERLASYKRIAKNKIQVLVGTKPPRTDWKQAYWPENFTPPRFHAPVVLLKRPKQPFYYVNDPQMGWGKRSQSGVAIHEVDFNHLHILREPHVGFFGEKVAECIKQVSRNKVKAVPEKSKSPLLATVGGYRGQQSLSLQPAAELPRSESPGLADS